MEPAFCDNGDAPPVAWRILEAESADCDTLIRPARVCRDLQVKKGGEAGLSVIAGAQRGLVHRSQLHELGIRRGSVARRERVGSLHRVLPSVFAVGQPALQPLAAETAALLHCVENAALSHATAAAAWGLLPGMPDEVAVTLIGRNVRQPHGLRIHRVPALDVRDVRIRHGLPVVAPARTIIDLLAVGSTSLAERALNEARVLRLVDDRQLTEALQRCPGRTGRGRLRALLEAERGPAVTRSEAERRLQALVERSELPWPQFNQWLHGHLVDAVWPEHRLVVEVDGYAVHGQRRAFESDRRRDQRLAAAGYTVIRVTWRQLRDEPMAVVARLAQALALAPGRAEM